LIMFLVSERAVQSHLKDSWARITHKVTWECSNKDPIITSEDSVVTTDHLLDSRCQKSYFAASENLNFDKNWFPPSRWSLSLFTSQWVSYSLWLWGWGSSIASEYGKVRFLFLPWGRWKFLRYRRKGAQKVLRIQKTPNVYYSFVVNLIKISLGKA
jgi:hypothetical protein